MKLWHYNHYQNLYKFSKIYIKTKISVKITIVTVLKQLQNLKETPILIDVSVMKR